MKTNTQLIDTIKEVVDEVKTETTTPKVVVADKPKALPIDPKGPLTEDEMKEFIVERTAYWVKTMSADLEIIAPKYEVKFSLSGKSAGRCDTSVLGNTGILNFNLDMALLNQELFPNTIGHEVAHLMLSTKWKKNCGHGKLFKEFMTKHGLDPATYHKMTVPPKKNKVIVLKERKILPIGTYKMPEIKTRAQAMEDGDTLYYGGPGTECEHGHIAPRYTRDNVCKQCNQLARVAKKEAKAAELAVELERVRAAAQGFDKEV